MEGRSRWRGGPDGVFLCALILATVVCDDIISSACCALGGGHVVERGMCLMMSGFHPKGGGGGVRFPPNSYNRVYNTITRIVTKCVLEVQNFIKIYKTLAGAPTHTCNASCHPPPLLPWKEPCPCKVPLRSLPDIERGLSAVQGKVSY